MYKATFDLITAHFSADRYLAELKAAREDYFRRTGKVFEDEPMFETRIAAFLEWFLLDRPLQDYGIPPVRFYASISTDTLTSEQKEQISSLEKSLHSLFRVARRTEKALRLEDLFSGEFYDVSERRQYPGLEKGDILDARLIRLKQTTHLTEAVSVHSREGHSFILQEVEKHKGKSPEEIQTFIFDLAYMKLKSERYQHLPAAEIYDWQTFDRDGAQEK